jgi:Predicted integral membrane protein
MDACNKLRHSVGLNLLLTLEVSSKGQITEEEHQVNWYLIIKFLHIVAVTLTMGGMLARQLVRAQAQKSQDINVVAALTRVAVRIDRALVIPWSNIMILVGIILAVVQKWPIFGFLQGSSQNWLLASNILLLIMIILIPSVFIPHNKKVESFLQTAMAEGQITPELSAALDDQRNKTAHYAEEIIVLVVAALMELKPF